MSYLTVNFLRKSPRKTSDKPEDIIFLVPLGGNLRGTHFQAVPPTSHLSGKTQGEKTKRQASPGSWDTAPAVSAERMLYVSEVIKTSANILITTVLVGFSFCFFSVGWFVEVFSSFPSVLYLSDWVGSKIMSLVFTGFKDKLIIDNGDEAWTKYHTGREAPLKSIPY